MVPRWPKTLPKQAPPLPWGSLGLSWGCLGRPWTPKTLKNKMFLKVFANTGFWYLQALDGPFGLILAPPWAVLGLSWAVLGLSWGCLGAVLGCLGVSWACLGAVLGLSRICLGLSWGCLGPVLGCLGPYTPQDAPKMAPRWPKIAPRRSQDGPSLLSPILGPESSQKIPRWSSRPSLPCSCPRFRKKFGSGR